MKQLIERNYKSIVDRGLIFLYTQEQEFFDKIDEEVLELSCATTWEDKAEELADIILVCLNYAYHFDIDIEHELNNKININELRAISKK